MFLERIVDQTRTDLQERKQAYPLEELRQKALAQPLPRSLWAALNTRPQIQLIAEVKRASPSKGMLAPHLEPVEQARIYAANGAAAISVLTEPHFFLGSPSFLSEIKQAVSIPVLRKDFIFDEYQVYEARAWGADAILLICAILEEEQLRHLLNCAHELGMHCLVEVHSVEEAQRAVAVGAQIIGVNSRDLVTFKMNPNLIRDLRSLIPADRIIIAESGIHNEADARRLAHYDIQGMLVGESLVVANNVAEQMRSLLYGANQSTQIKICGLRELEHLNVAVEAGADLLGLIFYPPSHRYLEPGQAKQMLDAWRQERQESNKPGPDLIGVFVNESVELINDIAEQLNLQFVQLHGTEPPEFCQRIKRPVIKALHMESESDLERVHKYKDVAWRIMLDTPTPDWGGSGIAHNWQLAAQIARETPIILAGGLNSENIAEAIRQVKPWGIDVSSGVETNKQKDSAKIQAFVQAVRATQQI